MALFEGLAGGAAAFTDGFLALGDRWGFDTGVAAFFLPTWLSALPVLGGGRKEEACAAALRARGVAFSACPREALPPLRLVAGAFLVRTPLVVAVAAFLVAGLLVDFFACRFAVDVFALEVAIESVESVAQKIYYQNQGYPLPVPAPGQRSCRKDQQTPHHSPVDHHW